MKLRRAKQRVSVFWTTTKLSNIVLNRIKVCQWD